MKLENSNPIHRSLDNNINNNNNNEEEREVVDDNDNDDPTLPIESSSSSSILASPPSSSSTPFSSLLHSLSPVLRHPSIPSLLACSVLLSLSSGLARASMSLVMLRDLQLPAEAHGYITSGVGVLAVLVNVRGVRLVVQLAGERNVLRLSALALSLLYLYYAAMPPSLPSLLLVLALLVLFGFSFSAVLASKLTASLPPSLFGTAIGLNMALSALARTITPFVAGYLESTSVLGIMSSTFSFIAFSIFQYYA